MEQEDTNIIAIKSAKLLHALASFVLVVNAGSFTRAAKLGGADKTVLSRRVSRLEDVFKPSYCIGQRAVSASPMAVERCCTVWPNRFAPSCWVWPKRARLKASPETFACRRSAR